MRFSNCSAVVSGANGFLGSCLVHQLASEGATVTALVRPGANLSRIDSLTDRIRIERVELRSDSRLGEIVAQADPRFAIHAAGDTAGRRGFEFASVKRCYSTNLDSTLAFLEAIHQGAPHIRCVVRLGTLEEYGNGPQPYVEDQREAPISAYSASMVAATYASQTLARARGIPLVTLRPALVFGPQQSEDFFIPWAIARCLRNEDLVLRSTGRQLRELLFIEDFADAVLAALSCPEAVDEIINVGGHIRVTIRELAEAICESTGANSAVRLGTADRTSDLQELTSNSSKARRLLDWQASTSLRDGLAKTVAWRRTQATQLGQ